MLLAVKDGGKFRSCDGDLVVNLYKAILVGGAQMSTSQRVSSFVNISQSGLEVRVRVSKSSATQTAVSVSCKQNASHAKIHTCVLKTSL